MKPHYCFFDTETTGLAYDSEVISIALVFTDKEYRILKSHVRHFFPDQDPSPEVCRINKYDHGLWLERQVMEGFTNDHDEWKKILDMMNEAKIVVAQNNVYDFCRLLTEVYKRVYLADSWAKLPRTLDLASFAKAFMDARGYYGKVYNSLRFIAAECKVSYKNAHDALADTLITLQCWKIIDEFYREKLK